MSSSGKHLNGELLSKVKKLTEINYDKIILPHGQNFILCMLHNEFANGGLLDHYSNANLDKTQRGMDKTSCAQGRANSQNSSP